MLPDSHQLWIQRCIELAERGAGYVSPNPLVGAVLVQEDGMVLGEGWHQAYGEAHAERNAIEDAIRLHGSEPLKKSTLYINLEPCSHFGKTPPCSDLIIESQIPRVVVGMVDPNPAVRGAGIKKLQSQGVEVISGVCEAECKRLNEAFSHSIETGRPLVTLKIAQTLDGRIATQTGHSRWISGEASRKLGHRWRASMDAVLIGSGTALADDPSLTVRHVEGRQPWRIVLDREGRLPASLRLFSDEYVGKTIAITADGVCPAYKSKLDTAGGIVLHVPLCSSGHLSLGGLLSELGRGDATIPTIQSLLVEAGPNLATALLEKNLVDRFYTFIAPKLIGKGLPAIDGLSVSKMDEALTFAEHRWEQVGQDILFQGYRRRF